jgi:hypothetical protein
MPEYLQLFTVGGGSRGDTITEALLAVDTILGQGVTVTDIDIVVTFNFPV